NRQAGECVGVREQQFELAFSLFRLSCGKIRSRDPELLGGYWQVGEAAFEEALYKAGFPAKGKEHQTAEIARCWQSELGDLSFALLIEFNQSGHIADLSSRSKESMQKLRK